MDPIKHYNCINLNLGLHNFLLIDKIYLYLHFGTVRAWFEEWDRFTNKVCLALLLDLYLVFSNLVSFSASGLVYKPTLTADVMICVQISLARGNCFQLFVFLLLFLRLLEIIWDTEKVTFAFIPLNSKLHSHIWSPAVIKGSKPVLTRIHTSTFVFSLPSPLLVCSFWNKIFLPKSLHNC